MTWEIALVLLLLAAVMVALALEWASVDVVAVVMALVLVLAGILTPEDMFAGFASEFVFVLCAIFVLSGTLARTGVMDALANGIERLAGNSERRAVGAIMASAAGLSAFLSNTNVTAVMVPAVLEYGRRDRISPSRLLIPLAYASMLGGSATLLGTSTNIAANALLPKLGLPPFELFEFLPVGAAVTVAGIALMVVASRWLLPERAPAELARQYEIDAYLSELVVEEESDTKGKTVASSGLADLGASVVSVLRAERRLLPVAAGALQAGDVLLVKGTREALLAAAESSGMRLEAIEGEADSAIAGDVPLAEAVIMPRSALRGRTLRQLRFRERYGVNVLALHRRGHSYPLKVSSVPLQVGDVLLLHGEADRLELLESTGAVWVVGEVRHLPFRRRKGLMTLAAVVAALGLTAAGVLPLSLAMLLAVLGVLAGGALRAEEIYGSIEWPLIVLVGAMTSMGMAMQKTGAADLLARLLVQGVAPLGVVALMAGLAVLTMVLTQPLSNAAAALVMLPVAVATATQLGLQPRPFAVLVTLAASLSFVAPLEPACLLVYAPGKYRFRDFIRAGVPLTLVALVVLLVLVPAVWPLV